MKEDNISSQLGDYDVPFCEQQYTNGSCYISLFKFKSFDHLIPPPPPPPQAASNFRHLLTCGTIGRVKAVFRRCTCFLVFKFSRKQQSNFRNASVSRCCKNSSLTIIWNNLDLSYHKCMKKKIFQETPFNKCSAKYST